MLKSEDWVVKCLRRNEEIHEEQVTDKRLVNYFGYNYYHTVKKEKKIVQAFKNNKNNIKII